MQEFTEATAQIDAATLWALDVVGVPRLPTTVAAIPRLSLRAAQLVGLVVVTGTLLAIVSGVVLGGVYYALLSFGR